MPPPQDAALSFNGRYLKKFLLTGQKPEVRRLEISKKNFIHNFQ